MRPPKRLLKPEPGLVIRYSYLWLREHIEGREEGVKDRPCAIVAAAFDRDGSTQVIVLPVTHAPPDREAVTLEIPPLVKQSLGLDNARSWVVISEYNQFTWPGPDLRRIGDRSESSIAYGFLPPNFFGELQRRYLALGPSGSQRVTRTE